MHVQVHVSTRVRARAQAALDLRDPSRLRFVEVSPRTANGCKLFAKDTAEARARFRMVADR